jgi:hypothetical protein
MWLSHVIDLGKIASKAPRRFRVEDIDTGRAAEQMGTFIVLLAIKDRASRVVFDPENERHELSYWIDGQRFDLDPPPKFTVGQLADIVRVWGKPRSIRARIALFLRRLADRLASSNTEWVVFKADGHYVSAVIHIEPPDQAPRIRVEFTDVPEFDAANSAWQILRRRVEGMDDPEAASPSDDIEREDEAAHDDPRIEPEGDTKIPRRNPWTAFREGSDLPDGIP